MQFLTTLDGLLEHIKSVEKETIELTNETHMRIARFIQSNGLQLDDETVESMQYQDIIAQQLSATIEAIESVQEHLRSFVQVVEGNDASVIENIDKMHAKLNATLERAEQRRSAFGGKLHHDDDDGIEFF
ncbi:MAG: hypothetical protein PHW64_07195 [Sulfuricurvum sp.]|nr:hypothetical protein [Sulfuricurvum sp.]